MSARLSYVVMAASRVATRMPGCGGASADVGRVEYRPVYVTRSRPAAEAAREGLALATGLPAAVAEAEEIEAPEGAGRE